MYEKQESAEFVGESRRFLEALEYASSIAQIERPVLVVGERGTGKELFASRIHFLSRRWDEPLIKVNCAAMASDLLESELFGHEAGAFTGAAKRHVGRFERAQGGTLFLDEIASASLQVQEKLLRVIEYGEYERVGGEKTLQADVRIVAAANTDLRKMAHANQFRHDLLDRLLFDVVSAPALRERAEDISLLAGHFARKMASELDEPFPGFSPSAMDQLRAHHWPGNVRELKNVTERAFFRWSIHKTTDAIETITIDPLQGTFGAFTAGQEAPAEPASRKDERASPRADMPPSDLKKKLNDLERDWTLAALDACFGSQKNAAKMLGLSYNQIRGLVRKHAIDTEEIEANAVQSA